MVGELKDGQIREYEIHPEDFGLTMMSSRNLKVADAAESKAMLLGVLDNQPGAAREIVALNAGTALYTANVADSIGAGIALAREALASGAARAKMEAFVACTKSSPDPPGKPHVRHPQQDPRREARGSGRRPRGGLRRRGARARRAQPPARDFVGAIRAKIAAGRPR
jgi:hypothetical protein